MDTSKICQCGVSLSVGDRMAIRLMSEGKPWEAFTDDEVDAYEELMDRHPHFEQTSTETTNANSQRFVEDQNPIHHSLSDLSLAGLLPEDPQGLPWSLVAKKAHAPWSDLSQYGTLPSSPTGLDPRLVMSKHANTAAAFSAQKQQQQQQQQNSGRRAPLSPAAGRPPPSPVLSRHHPQQHQQPQQQQQPAGAQGEGIRELAAQYVRHKAEYTQLVAQALAKENAMWDICVQMQELGWEAQASNPPQPSATPVYGGDGVGAGTGGTPSGPSHGRHRRHRGGGGRSRGAAGGGTTGDTTGDQESRVAGKEKGAEPVQN